MDKNKILSWSIVALTAALISMIVLFAPVNAGVRPENGRNISDNGDVIIGERNLNFLNASGDIIPNGTIKSTWGDSHITIPFEGPFDSSYETDLVTGDYKVEGQNGNITISFYTPKLDVKTKVQGEYFDWVTRGGNITFEATTNLYLIRGNLTNNISYKLINPDGVRVYEVNNRSLSNIDVSSGGVNYLLIDTTGMKTGLYTLRIETDPDTNNGLDTKGPEVSFEVKIKGVTIEANKNKQTVTNGIAFTVSTTPNTPISLDVTWGIESKVTFGAGGHNVSTESDKDGKYTVEAYFADTGSYEITAIEHIADTTDSIFVEIVPYEAEVKTDKSTYHIGEIVKITCLPTAGDSLSITLKIDDEVVATAEPVEGFEYTWKTEEKLPGLYTIAMWVLPLSNPDKDPPDDSKTIILLRGGLLAKAGVGFVAQGDHFSIDGTVPGRDRVDILTIAPKGGSGRGFDPQDIFNESIEKIDAPGLTYTLCGVDTNGKFRTDKIAVSEDVDTGMYLIAVLNYGQDGVWGKSDSDNLVEVISNNYTTALTLKTADQILAILKEKTINAAGSDDLLDVATINVENGFITLDDIEDVLLGESVEATGITNRNVGESVIVTVAGLGADATDFKPKTATIEAYDKIVYNKFSVSFDTASAKIGEYKVTADDEDEHYDTTTVNIVLAVEPSVNVTDAPDIAMPTLEPESTNATPGPTQRQIAASKVTKETAAEKTATEEQPGFESVFTVAGLLIATWLMLRMRLRRENKQK